MAFSGWRFVLGFVLVGSFFCSLFLSVTSPHLFVSPDETANAVFIQEMKRDGTLQVDGPYLELGPVHPRSTFSSGVEGILPVGFLGLPVVYGWIVSLLGMGVLPYITAVISLLGVLSFFWVMKRWKGERFACLSTILLATHPAWMYYTARHLMPNVLFVSFLLFAAFFWSTYWYKHVSQKTESAHMRSSGYVLLGGICVGLALFVRTSEIVWVLPVLIGLFLFLRKTVCCRVLKMALFGIVIGLIPPFVYNQQTFGGPLIFGYQAATQSVSVAHDVLADTAAQVTLLTPRVLWDHVQVWLAPVFPFGVHPRTVVRNVGAYGFLLFGWLTILMAIGIFSRKNVLTKWLALSFEKKMSIGLFLCAALWLLVAYGSWTIVDNPDPTQISIANSYIRYWLLLFVVSVVFAAQGMEGLAKVISKKTKISAHWIMPVLLLCIVGLNVYATVGVHPDGLRFVAAQLERDGEIKEELLARVPKDAIVIVDRADKLLWPERAVVTPLRSETTYALMPTFIEKNIPLYYYGVTFPVRDLTYLNEVKLAEEELKITLIQRFDAESLYEITPR